MHDVGIGCDQTKREERINHHKVGDLVLQYFPEPKIGSIIKCYSGKEEYPEYLKEFSKKLDADGGLCDIEWSSGRSDRDIEMYEGIKVDRFKYLYSMYMSEAQ